MNLALLTQGLRWAAEFLTVESSGVKRSPTISDELGVMFSCSMVMRLLCLAWLGPAVALVWIGFGSIGVRSIPPDELDMALDRAQAAAILLALFSTLIGLLWALRTMDYLPTARRVGAGSTIFGRSSHVAAGALSLLACPFATAGGPVAGAAAVIASFAGFYALSFIARWLLLAPIEHSFPLATLAAGAAFQVTVGWLHVLHPTGPLAPLLVLEGLMLAWTAVAAVRVVEVADSPVPEMAAAGDVATVETVSQAPTQQSLPEPAVGR